DRRCARGANGRRDAAARLRNIGVCAALDSRCKLVGAVARINEMRVAVDETGCEPAPARVERSRGAPIARHVARCADPGNAIPTDAYGAVADGAVGRVTRHGLENRVLDDQIEGSFAHFVQSFSISALPPSPSYSARKSPPSADAGG